MPQVIDRRFTSFDGGLNLKENPNLLKNNEFQIFDNITFSTVGLGAQRSGEQNIGVRIGDEPITGLFRYHPSNQSTETLIVHDGDLYIESGGTINNTPVYTGFTSGNFVDMTEVQDQVYMVDSSTNMVRYDGTNVFDVGITEPASAPTAAGGGGAGNLNGAYTWVVTFISDNTESDPSPISNEITLTNEDADLTSVPTSSNSAVNKRGIYRVQASGSEYLKVGEINDNTTTTFTDNVADSDLGSLVDEEAGKPPSGLSCITDYHNFLFAGGGGSQSTRLYYSKQLDFGKWDELNFIDIQGGNAKSITSLEVIQDQLYIFKQSGISILRGFSESEFSVSDILADLGTPTSRSTTATEGAIYFYDGGQRIFRLAGGDIDEVSFKIEPELEKVTDSSSVALDVDNEGQLHVAYKTPEGQDRELVRHLRREAWTRYKGRCINVYARRFNDTLVAGCGREGRIREIDKSITATSSKFLHMTTGTSQVLSNQYTAREFINGYGGGPHSVFVRLRKNGTPNGTLQCHFYSDDGGEPANRLKTSSTTIDETTLDTSYGWHEFSFDGTPTMGEGITFHLVLETDNSAGAGNEVEWQGESGSFSSDTTHTSSDAATWNEDNTLALNMRLYTEDIPWKVKSARNDFGRPEHRKQVRRFTTNFEATEGDIQVNVYGDGQKVSETFVKAQTTGSQWGTMVWGEDDWGGAVETIAERSVSPSNIGRKLSFEFLSDSTVSFSLFSFHAKIFLRRRH